MICYCRNILIAIDQLANALLGGDPDETISSRAGKKYPAIAKVIDFILGRNHCKNSIEADEGKDSIGG